MAKKPVQVEQRVMPSLVVGDIKGVSPMEAPKFVDLNNNGINDADEYPNSAEEDSYLSQSELTPNARFVSEVLNDILYKIHRNRLTQNEVNKLRTQIENGVSIR